MITLITAGGDATRWGGTYPKQLVDINGEPLLVRSVRMLSKYCDNVQILSNNEDIKKLFPGSWMPARHSNVDECIESALNFFRAHVHPHIFERILVVHGDVYFTTDFAKKVCKCTEPLMFYGTNMEIFAVEFIPSREVVEHLEKAASLAISGYGRGQLWEFWRHASNIPVDMYEMPSNSIYTHILDGTRDFDYLWQYEGWLEQQNDGKSYNQEK